MSRHTALVLTASLLSFALGLAASIAPSHAAADGAAVCVTVPQKPMRLDEEFVARFMNEQLDQGRTRFETVTGLSTVLCAW